MYKLMIERNYSSFWKWIANLFHDDSESIVNIFQFRALWFIAPDLNQILGALFS